MIVDTIPDWWTVPREGNGRKWEREGKEEARIVHRARDVSLLGPGTILPFIFIFQGKFIVRLLTVVAVARGSLGRNWRVSSWFSSLVLLFFALFLYNSRFLSSSVLVFSWSRLYIYIYICVCGE